MSADGDGAQDVYERSGGTTTLVSIGGGGSYGASFGAVSQDGGRVFFVTRESLVSGDSDSAQDVYERSGGVTKLVSTGPTGGNSASDAFFAGASLDGTHVYVHTDESLTSDDIDVTQDVYDRSGGTTTRLSFGPTGGNGGFEEYFDASFVGSSGNGSRAFLATDEQLVSTDVDDVVDLYERSGGATTLLSTGPGGGNGPDAAAFAGASEDGSRVFVQTSESLVSNDLDDASDVYERSGGTTTLLSTAPGDSGQALDASFVGATPDGTRVFLTTALSLLAADLDGGWRDVYQRSAGTTTLISTGAGAGAFNAFFAAASDDAKRVFFTTTEPLSSADTDAAPDVYERSSGSTTLISTGPAGGNGVGYTTFGGASADGTRAFFSTSEQLLASDLDGGGLDVYKASVVHAAPASASPVSVSLVPVFRQCGTAANRPNGAHRAPFALGSCSSAGTTGAAKVGPQAVGSALMSVAPGDLTTVADEADLALTGSISDVRATSVAGPDYNPNPTGPDLTFVLKLRITDLASGASQTEAATATELDFAVPFDCVSTSGPEGANCTLNTTADATIPGLIAEGRRTVLQGFRVRVNDSGPNGSRGDGDDRLFQQQGYYVP